MRDTSSTPPRSASSRSANETFDSNFNEAEVERVPQEVFIRDLIEDPRFQARSGIYDGTVLRYGEMLWAGVVFPPIEVALIENRPYIVDGFHRVAAYRKHGRETIFAYVTPMNEWAALEASARANMQHGLPLNQRELGVARRQLVKAYIQQGKHRHGRYKVKPLRQMVPELGIPKSTLDRILRKYHPDLHSRHWASEKKMETVDTSGTEKRLVAALKADLIEIEQTTKRIRDDSNKSEIIETIEAMLSRLKTGPDFAPIEFSDAGLDTDEF